MRNIPPEWLADLAKIREKLKNGDETTQGELDAICSEWKSRQHLLSSGEKDEWFDLVDSNGQPNKLTAERWLCHLLALRHRCTHVLLRWTGSGLGNVFVLQIRAWDKADSPGHLDISVGGHVTSDTGFDLTKTAEDEMYGELGIKISGLKHSGLMPCGGYPIYDEREENNFFNAEWREVYVADVTTETFTRIDFKDKEVTGLLLCPESEALNFLDQQKNKHLAVASALRGSLERCLLSLR